MPERAAPGNRVPASEVRTMFDRIAPIYDRMNGVMTGGLDRRWRRRAARAAGIGPGMSVVDVACGTGALSRELARLVGATGSVIGIDTSESMLRLARRRRAAAASATPRYEQGDALELPLADDTVDAATIAFGLRNMRDYKRCLAEMARVTRPGGRVVVLEIATPRGGPGRVATAIWLRGVVPFLGRLAGGGAAYRYLPASAREYPGPEEVATLMRDVGLAGVRWRPLALGMVTLHAGRVA